MNDVFEYAFGGEVAEGIYSVIMTFSQNEETIVFERSENPDQEYLCNTAVCSLDKSQKFPPVIVLYNIII